MASNNGSGESPKGRIPSLRFLKRLTNPKHVLYVSQQDICRTSGIAPMTLSDVISGKTKRPRQSLVFAACGAIYEVLDKREAALKELKK